MIDQWKLNLLKCDACKGTLNLDSDSKLFCIKCQKEFEIKNGIIINHSVSAIASFEFYEACGGTHLRERSKKSFSTAYYETKKYYRCFGKTIFKDMTPVLEVGCGDGRNIDWLLNNGFERIVATDFNLQSLKKYKQGLSEESLQKILFVNSDLLHLPLKINSFKSALAIEVLYYLNEDYKLGCEKIYELLEYGGIFINSEPTLEGALLYNLIADEIPDFIRSSLERKKREGKDTSVLARVFQNTEIHSILEGVGFSVYKQYGISAFASLAMVVLRKQDYTSEIKSKLTNVLEELMSQEATPYRCITYISKKAPR